MGYKREPGESIPEYVDRLNAAGKKHTKTLNKVLKNIRERNVKPCKSCGKELLPHEACKCK